VKVLLQRVSSANVSVDSKIIGEIAHGWLILLGVSRDDQADLVPKMVEKVLTLRLFADECGKFNLSVQDVSGSLLVVSQFTLYADCSQGRRPGFQNAGKPEIAKSIYEKMILEFKKSGLKTESGKFGADMKVSLVNDGPVTVMLDSDEFLKKDKVG
jgi:D-tyrosyl-tRNA(Tyr) deacylase